MHNETPLGTMMHLKDLDRQATPKLAPSREGGRYFYLATAIRRETMSLLGRLQGVRIPVRVASRG